MKPLINQLRLRKSLGIKVKPKRVLVASKPMNIQVGYAREIIRMVQVVRELVKPLMAELPALVASSLRDRMDSGESRRVRELVSVLRLKLNEKVTTESVEAVIKSVGDQTSRFGRQQLSKQIKHSLGIDVLTVDNKVPALLEGFINTNVALIKNLPNTLLDDVEKTIQTGFAKGMLSRDLSKELSKKFNLSEKRAKLIARDQISKLNGQINAVRQRDLGITQFIWRTAGDERVREEHVELDGQLFSYNNPPAIGLPGEEINCRCTAEPDFTSLLNDPQ